MESASTWSTSANKPEQVGGRRLIGGACEPAHGLIVGFARRQQRQLVDGDGANRACGHTRRIGRRPSDVAVVVPARGGDHEAVVVVGAERRHARSAQRGLDLLEIDAQAVHLDEPAVAADTSKRPSGARRAMSPVRSVSTVLPSARSSGPCA